MLCEAVNINATIQAVIATKNSDTTLFDIRAAVHEKLEDSKSALKDGQHMLRLDKTAGQV